MAPTTRSAASNAPDEPPAATSDPLVVIIIPPTTQPAGEPFISERYLTSSGWPEGLILELHKSNWTEWCQHLELLAVRTGFTKWLDNTIPRPDELLFPKAATIWDSNDNSLHAFILEKISVVNFELVKRIDTSYDVFQALRRRHEKLGLYAQLLLLKEALEICFDMETLLSTTVTQIWELHNRIYSMGPIDQDKLFSILLINALGNLFPHLQTAFQTLTDTPGFSLEMLTKQLDTEEGMITRRKKGGADPLSTPTSAFPANAEKKKKTPCSNCKCEMHGTDYCILSSGKMAGKTIEEAHAAQRAASGKRPWTQAAHVTTASTSDTAATPSPDNLNSSPTSSSIVVNGLTYFLP